MIKSLYIILVAAMAVSSCSNAQEGFTSTELTLINEAESIMRVLTIDDENDLEVLRSKSIDIPAGLLGSKEYKKLTDLMIATVTHPSQDGVGIAAPQVGINRRVVAVQRFDKEGEPFEVYPNVRIVWSSDSLASGPEGCLSVPGRRGDVMRSEKIIIEYADVTRLSEEDFMVRDTVQDFTAVIFQHEIDHLDGVLYIDRL
jgi:peptide deformylase